MNKMLPTKTIIIALTALTFLLSCSKKEGCNYNEALNYDNLVVVDDGSCTFTTFTFYANSTHLNGVFIEKIDVKVADNKIGTFSGMEDSGNACGMLNTASYTPQNVENVFWTSEIHLLDSLIDTVIVRSGEIRTSASFECLEVNVLF